MALCRASLSALVSADAHGRMKGMSQLIVAVSRQRFGFEPSPAKLWGNTNHISRRQVAGLAVEGLVAVKAGSGCGCGDGWSITG